MFFKISESYFETFRGFYELFMLKLWMFQDDLAAHKRGVLNSCLKVVFTNFYSKMLQK